MREGQDSRSERSTGRLLAYVTALPAGAFLGFQCAAIVTGRMCSVGGGDCGILAIFLVPGVLLGVIVALLCVAIADLVYRQHSPRALVAVLCLVGAFVLVLIGAVFDGDEVQTRAELRNVSLGLPWDWVEQDQSGLITRPIPRQPSVQRFQDAGSDAHEGYLLLNTLTVAGALYGAFEIGRRITQRRVRTAVTADT